MKINNFNSFSNIKGFTLVELAVVLVIVMTLAVVAIPNFKMVRHSVRNKAAIADISNIQKAIEAHIAEKAEKPLSLNEIKMDNFVDPWKKSYIYTKDPSITSLGGVLLNTDYDIYSTGSDGVSSDDDIVRADNGTYIGIKPE